MARKRKREDLIHIVRRDHDPVWYDPVSGEFFSDPECNNPIIKPDEELAEMVKNMSPCHDYPKKRGKGKGKPKKVSGASGEETFEEPEDPIFLDGTVIEMNPPKSLIKRIKEAGL